jgi:outer membrane protein assembly factor BamA
MHYVYESGYLLANYEQLESDSSFISVRLELGPKFRWTSLDQGNLPDELLFKNGYRKSFFDQEIVNFKKISKLFTSIIKHSENNGYPFANIRLKKLAAKENRLSAQLYFDPGPYITFDSLVFINRNRIKSSFLGAYLKIKPGAAYDQRKVDNLPNLINVLPYISIQDDPILYFANQQCQVHLDLIDEKASAFDGLIGFLPNENEEGKILITGQLYLKLENLFKSGKKLELNWQKVNTLSQELFLSYDHPALLRTPLDVALAFELYKQDTTFLNRDLGVNLFYNNYNQGRIGMHYERKVSRLLQTSNNDLDELIYADYNVNYYGLAYIYNSLDHQIFPSRGWQVFLNLNAGNKSILQNANIDEGFYDDIPENGFQWQSKFWISKFFSLRPKNVLLSKISLGYMDGDQLFFNDFFRLGGLNSIRGFNEMFFYASKYVIGTLEYRYLFENESQILVFIDGSILGYEFNGTSYSDYPVGMGTGISLSTKAGLLNVIYALGHSNGQSFNLKYSKIHIGYTGRF